MCGADSRNPAEYADGALRLLQVILTFHGLAPLFSVRYTGPFGELVAGLLLLLGCLLCMRDPFINENGNLSATIERATLPGIVIRDRIQ